MKKYTVFASLLLISIFSIAQQAVIRYEFIYNKNFERGKDLVYFQSWLNIKNGESWFFSIPDTSKIATLGAMDSYPAIDTLFGVYKNLSEERLVFIEPDFTGRSSYYRDTLHPMTWELKNETQKIGDFECQKATTVFRGRSYTAWFSPSIPIPNGPWKMGGLPGLIMVLYEDNNDMYISLRSISFTSSPGKIFLPADINRLPDYEKYKNNWRELFKRMDATLTASKSNPDCVSCKEESKSKINLWEKW
ncbi:GLPGLI family protein [Pollutibacter soli]|uniref:GLPGLI family protein n=1 Tax=Pollutibacter soli TaxID=3034157 RepID=UPI003013E3E4